MTPARAAKLLATALVAAGCTTVGPDYERPRIPLPGAYPQASAPAGPEVPAAWWRLYADPVLEGLVAGTLAKNTDLRLAAARVEETEAALREAGAAFLPEVTAGYAFAKTHVSERTVPLPSATAPLTRPQYQLVASTSFELDFWGRFSRADEAARANLLAARYARDVVRLTLAGAAAQAYFGLRSLDAQLAVLARTIAVRGDSLALAEARLKAGLASELDVLQAQGALADAQVQRREAARQRAGLERQLGQLTGNLEARIPPGDLFALPVPPTPPAGLPSALLDRRPDIRAAEESLRAANAQIGVARAAVFPAITLTAARGAQSATFANLLAGGAGIWSLGYALALPIFDAGRREARADQASARQRQTLAAYQKAIETGFREVADGLTNAGESAAAEADLEARLGAARNALDLSKLRYEAGYSPFLEVLDAQRTVNDAELAFVRNRQSRLAYSVDLMKALGGGWRSGETRGEPRAESAGRPGAN